MTTPSVRVGGVWQPLNSGNGIYVNVAGTWQPVQTGSVRVGGSWVSSYVRDVTGPVNPTGVTFAWTAGGYTVNWTNPGDADYAGMYITIAPYNESNRAYQVPVGSGHSLVDATYTAAYYNVWYAYLTPYDTNGNLGATTVYASMEHTGAARGRMPSPFTIDPTGSSGYSIASNNLTVTSTGAGNYNTGRITSGVINEYIGMMYYGDQFYNYLRGANVTAASVQLYMVNTNGSSSDRKVYMFQNVLSSGAPASFTYDGSGHFADVSGQDLGSVTESPLMSIGGSSPNYATVPFALAEAQRFGSYNVTRVHSLKFFDGSGFWGPQAWGLFIDNYDNPTSSPVVPGRITIAHDG